MSTKHDCVFCNHENVDNPSHCDYFNEKIGIPGLEEIRSASRGQDSCPGFQIRPHMLDTWQREFGTAPQHWLAPEVQPLVLPTAQLEVLVERLTTLTSHEDLQTMLADARALAPATSGWETPVDLGKPEEHARACIHLASHGVDAGTTRKFWYRALRSDVRDSVRATCLYLVTTATDDNFLRELLVSDDPLRPSRLAVANPEAPYHMVQIIGLSGRHEFASLLVDLLTVEHHFVGQRVILDALEQLGVRVDDDSHSAGRSISVSVSSADREIVIHEDPKYGGSSECAGCRFFPCRINHHHTGGIERCKLWNKTDPATLSKISDYRSWGQHLQVVESGTDPLPAGKLWLREADRLIAHGQHRAAIAPLCDALVAEAELGEPLAWLMLGECMLTLGEPMFSYACFYAASQFKLRADPGPVRAQLLAAFERERDQRLRELLDPSIEEDVYDHLSQGYWLVEDWVRALDYRMVVTLLKPEQASAWARMGACFTALGELRLAEVCMRKAVAVSHDRSQAERFHGEADDLRARLREGIQDVLFDPAKRTGDRTVVRTHTGAYSKRAQLLQRPSPSAAILRQVREPLDPMTLQFTNTTERASRLLIPSRNEEELVFGIHEGGDTLLAVEILQIMASHGLRFSDKARCLAIAGQMLAEAGNQALGARKANYGRELHRVALDYFAWAADLDPTDSDLRDAVEQLFSLFQ